MPSGKDKMNTDTNRTMKLQSRVLLLFTFVLFAVSTVGFAADPEKAKEAYNKGVTSKQEGKLDEAGLYFAQATSLDPDYFDAYLNLGSVLFEQKKFDEAKTAFKSATEKNSKSEEAFSNLGKVYAKLKQYTDAEGAFKSAIALNDKSPELHRELSKIYLENNNTDQLMQSVQKCHELGGGDEVTWYMLGKGHDSKKQTADALTAYQKSADIKKNYNAYNGIGKIHLEKKAYKEAAGAFKAALDADGKKWRAAYNYANAMENSDPAAIDENIKNWDNFVRIAKGDPKAANDVATAKAHIEDLKKSKAATAGTN